MNRTESTTQAASPVGRVYVSATDPTLKYLEDALESEDGSITITRMTDPTTGSEYLNIEVSGSGSGIAVVEETGRVKVTGSGSTLQYLEDVLSAGTGISITTGADSITITLDAALDDLTDVDTTGAVEGSILTNNGSGGWVVDKKIVGGTGSDMGIDVDEQNAEVPTRQMVNEYIANLQFAGIDGTGENYTEPSMWRTEVISHEEMRYCEITQAVDVDGYPKALVGTEEPVFVTTNDSVTMLMTSTGIGYTILA